MSFCCHNVCFGSFKWIDEDYAIMHLEWSPLKELKEYMYERNIKNESFFYLLFAISCMFNYKAFLYICEIDLVDVIYLTDYNTFDFSWYFGHFEVFVLDIKVQLVGFEQKFICVDREGSIWFNPKSCSAKVFLFQKNQIRDQPRRLQFIPLRLEINCTLV